MLYSSQLCTTVESSAVLLQDDCYGKHTLVHAQGRCMGRQGHLPDGCLIINHEACRVLLPIPVLIPIFCFALMLQESLHKACKHTDVSA